MYNKKDKLMNWFNLFFTVFQIMNFAVFIYLASKIVWPIEQESPFLAFAIIFASILLFLVVKITLQLASGFIFGSGKTIGEIIYKKLSYLNYSSLIVFIANMILAYITKDSAMVVYATVSIDFFNKCHRLGDHFA